MISKDMLMKKYLLNVNIIECIKRGTANILFESMDSIVIWDRKAEMYLISAESLESAKKAIEFIPKDAELILAHQEFYCDLISKKCGFTEVIPTYHSVWTKKEHIEVPKFDGEIKTLTIEYLDEVRKHYTMFDIIGEDTIREALEEGNIMGAFIDNKLCGFIGEHLEGSIGMLEVFKEYRRKGIAGILEATAINKALDEGRVPFGEVRIENKASIKLQEKMGLDISKEILYWLE